jgi:hypothetical protein
VVNECLVGVGYMACGIMAWPNLGNGCKIDLFVGALGHLVSNSLGLERLFGFNVLILNVYIMKVFEYRGRVSGKS